MKIIFLSSKPEDDIELAQAIGHLINAPVLQDAALDNAVNVDTLLLLSTAQSREQASALDAAFARQGIAPDLVLCLDASHHDSSAPTKPSPAAAYFAEQGRLRRIRAEATANDIVAVAARIIDDIRQAQRREDRFAEMLRQAEQQTAHASAAATAEALPVVKSDSSAAPKIPGWKRAAEQSGKLKRHRAPIKGKASRKPNA
jgi:hypothetical protein